MEENKFLKKFRSLPKLPEGIILCMMNISGLYPNMLHEEGLSGLRKRLETRKEKYVSTDTIYNIFTFRKQTQKQKWGSAIRTKFAPPYSILFMAGLEEEIIN